MKRTNLDFCLKEEKKKKEICWSCLRHKEDSKVMRRINSTLIIFLCLMALVGISLFLFGVYNPDQRVFIFFLYIALGGLTIDYLLMFLKLMKKVGDRE